MLRPGGAAARAMSRTFRTPLTTATVEALPFLRTLSYTERRPSLRTTFCCTAQPSCTWPTSVTNTVLPVDVFDWNIVEVSDAHWHRIGPHRVLRVADLGETGWQSQILSADRVHHVCRGQASGLQLDWIDLDHDL